MALLNAFAAVFLIMSETLINKSINAPFRQFILFLGLVSLFLYNNIVANIKSWSFLLEKAKAKNFIFQRQQSLSASRHVLSSAPLVTNDETMDD